jgi:osmotically inducible lipoprotein OsmB
MAMTRNRVSGRTAAAGRTLPGATIVGPLLAALVLVGAAVSLAGCGDDPATRGVTGGLIGAGAGAGVAAIAGGKPATGALVGGGVGALGGVLTSP